jgi:MinD-like ATPase involved in chromosome partitioning or flagellar assembly
MYITTFYSFKGGVGRSMALANAAVELAKRGRRVLAVDFDLEAPGLDTFDVLRPRDGVPGIIDFVHEYLDSNRAPDIGRFLARSPDIGDRGGELWIMPSGAQQASYAAHFNQIDWAELYEKRDGYLLFEDLKAQWQQIVNPDYVLIDSRTGHTDTGGICTRQLPDAVAILFFPNEQNLRGLTKVVNDIRSEIREPPREPIELHFIMSNVPDLDDEDEILENKIQEFRNQLALTPDPLIVHRYDSLSLLNQVVFTQARPKSRLAKEYCAVVDEFVGRNLDDRDGALDYIERTAKAWRDQGETYEPPSVLDEKLRRIEQAHSEDGEVLFALGKFRKDDPRVKPDASLFDRAIESGYDQPEAHLQRARVRSRNHDPSGAIEDALRALQADRVPPPLIWEAVSLAEELRRPDEILASISILNQIVGDLDVPEEVRAAARTSLATRLIATGSCSEAAKLLRHAERSVENMDIRDAFNYGMAVWGASGEIVPDPFVRVVEFHQSESESESGPNYLQCMAVALWATGSTATAAKFEVRAREAVRGSEFSCWRYTEVTSSEFIEDLDDIQALIGGDATRVPRFMRSKAVAGTSG